MHDNGVGELKRMFTRPEVRGKRIGSHLVDAIVELARAKGASRLVLETGTGPGFDGAGGFMKIRVLRVAEWFWIILTPNTAPF